VVQVVRFNLRPVYWDEFIFLQELQPHAEDSNGCNLTKLSEPLEKTDVQGLPQEHKTIRNTSDSLLIEHGHSCRQLEDEKSFARTCLGKLSLTLLGAYKFAG
jgi:hypothetical protein